MTTNLTICLFSPVFTYLIAICVYTIYATTETGLVQGDSKPVSQCSSVQISLLSNLKVTEGTQEAEEVEDGRVEKKGNEKDV